jgi:hypothetical protein
MLLATRVIGYMWLIIYGNRQSKEEYEKVNRLIRVVYSWGRITDATITRHGKCSLCKECVGVASPLLLVSYPQRPPVCAHVLCPVRVGEV